MDLEERNGKGKKTKEGERKIGHFEQRHHGRFGFYVIRLQSTRLRSTSRWALS